jgi:hypothetical protein
MKRKPKSRIYTPDGSDLGAIEDPIDPFGIPREDQSADPITWVWIPSPDPAMMQATVPMGTPFPPDLISGGARTNYPAQGYVTYYSPTTAAMLSARFNAAVDTVADVGSQAAAAVKKVGDYGPMLLLGLAALFVLFQWEKLK